MWVICYYGLVNFSELDFGWILINIVVLLFSLSIHEAAHAWAADQLGDPTGRDLGRVTLNPVAHVDPLGTVLFPLIGLIGGGLIFGWAKPVPVHPGRLENPKKGSLLVAAAGPASNVVAACGFLIVLKIFPMLLSSVGPEDVAYPFFLLCQQGLFLNVILAVFNLIPIPPLDGSWILAGLLPDHMARWIDSVRPYSFMLLILLLMSGTLGSILGPVLGFVQRLAF